MNATISDDSSAVKIDALALWDWRRQVARLYAAAATEVDAERAWRDWRAGRDRLFATHPQSPLESDARRVFDGLRFFPHDPALRFRVELSPLDDATPFAVDTGRDGAVLLRPVARTRGLSAALAGELTLYWIEGYGGGAFLPFADATSGKTTYGGGRYLVDTIKGADLGFEPPNRMIVDFNFAYNPSCSYSNRYVCPLAPEANRLKVAIEAGEITAPS